MRTVSKHSNRRTKEKIATLAKYDPVFAEYVTRWHIACEAWRRRGLKFGKRRKSHKFRFSPDFQQFSAIYPKPRYSGLHRGGVIAHALQSRDNRTLTLE